MSFRALVRAYSAWLQYLRDGRWARAAAAAALPLIERGVHEAIVTSGPPHMAHEAGRLISENTGLPFVMDMRDPWSLARRLSEDVASPLWLFFASRYERRTVARAALVVTNTDSSRLEMSRAYPQAAARMITVMNGSDEGPVPATRRGDCFVLAYAGEIYLDRDPRLLFRAAGHVVRELGLTPLDFRIELIGSVDRYGSIPLSEIARDEGIEGFIVTGPPRAHQAALEFLAQAHMLVSLPQDDDLAIPAKIFEYVRFEAWVLVLAKSNSATGLLFQGSGVDVVSPSDLEGIVDVLRKRFLAHRQGIRPVRLASDGRFSRRAQAQILFDAIATCSSAEPSSRTAIGNRS